MNEWQEYLVLKRSPPDVDRLYWDEVGRTEADSAMSAFRALVMGNRTAPQVGEYLIVSLNGNAHIAVGYELRDLNADV